VVINIHVSGIMNVRHSWFCDILQCHIPIYLFSWLWELFQNLLKGARMRAESMHRTINLGYFTLVSVETIYLRIWKLCLCIVLCSLRFKSPMYLSFLRLAVSGPFIFVDRENCRTYRIESLSDSWILTLFRYISTYFRNSWYFSALQVNAEIVH
jgi:hypothetical protein